MKRSELRPCPFCGIDNKWLSVERIDADDPWYVQCSCGAGMIGQTRTRVMKQWNVRAVDSRVAERLRAKSGRKGGDELEL